MPSNNSVVYSREQTSSCRYNRQNNAAPRVPALINSTKQKVTPSLYFEQKRQKFEILIRQRINTELNKVMNRRNPIRLLEVSNLIWISRPLKGTQDGTTVWSQSIFVQTVHSHEMKRVTQKQPQKTACTWMYSSRKQGLSKTSPSLSILKAKTMLQVREG